RAVRAPDEGALQRVERPAGALGAGAGGEVRAQGAGGGLGNGHGDPRETRARGSAQRIAWEPPPPGGYDRPLARGSTMRLRRAAARVVGLAGVFALAGLAACAAAPAARAGAPARLDLAIAIDVSGSAAAASGIDVDGDGTIGV